MKHSPKITGRRTLAILLAAVTLALGEQPGSSASTPDAPRTSGVAEAGIASYYADRYHGRPTASGEVFNTRELTAAHRTLPFGTRVKVTDLKNNLSVIVRINDRGPFVEGRVIDLSRAAAEKLQLIRTGLAKVRVEIVPPPA